MKDVLWVGMITIGIMFFFIVVMACFYDSDYYHYIDIDGKEGYSGYCSSYRSAMHCSLPDGGDILVKEYHVNR